MSNLIAPAFFVVLIIAFLIGAQTPPPAAIGPDRKVGSAEIYYNPKTDHTYVRTFSYIQGSVPDIYQKKKEVIGMSLEYGVRGQKMIEPKSVFFALTSYSAHPEKYTTDHKMVIFVDGKELLSETGVDRYASMPFLKSSSESYAIPRLPYADFIRMADAKKVAVQIGPTKIDLKPEAVKAIQDLKATIKN